MIAPKIEKSVLLQVISFAWHVGSKKSESEKRSLGTYI